MSKLDFVVFGASGFTGKYVIEELIRWQQDEHHLTFAIAGRNKDRLSDVLKQVKKALDVDCCDIEMIVADVNDVNSLNAMCKRARVILNCVGPYRFFGEPVVVACLENDTHYIDISGEPQFLESMALKYNDHAESKKLLVISSCGFDSIPCDLGVLFTQKQFNGDTNDIESFLSLHTGPLGSACHYATYQSAIHGFANANELKKIRKDFSKRNCRKSSTDKSQEDQHSIVMK